VLRLLESKRAEELASQLLDILMLFGASCVLQSGTGREFCSEVVDDLTLSSPLMPCGVILFICP
jgi:hypothetical protein